LVRGQPRFVPGRTPDVAPQPLPPSIADDGAAILARAEQLVELLRSRLTAEARLTARDEFQKEAPACEAGARGLMAPAWRAGAEKIALLPPQKIPPNWGWRAAP
jgi:hypothetical protein